jgi:NAD(P)H-dependent FMN reductase
VLLQVITGTTRQGRFSELVAGWVHDRMRSHGGFDVEAIDLRDHRLPFLDAEMAPARAGGVYEDAEVARFGGLVARADGFLILTGEYNHGYPAVLKNAMDSTFVEWRRKPISFVGWGNVGGARAIEQLRQVAVEFEMAPSRWAVHILPDVMIPLRQAVDPTDRTLLAPLDPRLTVLADDMAWWMRALAAARAVDG